VGYVKKKGLGLLWGNVKKLDGTVIFLLRPWPHCVRWRLSSPTPKGAQQPPPVFGPCLLWRNGRPSQLLLRSCCTAHGRESLCFTTGRPLFPLQLPLPKTGSKPVCNTWFLGPTRVLNQIGTSIGSAVFAQLMAERVYTLQRTAISPSKLSLPMWGCGPHLMMIPLAHTSPQPKQHVDWFSRFCTAYCSAEYPYTLQWHANCPFPWGFWTPMQHMIPWSHPSPQYKQHLDQFSRFCRTHYCDRTTDRLTDQVTRSATTGRIYVHSTAM